MVNRKLGNGALECYIKKVSVSGLYQLKYLVKNYLSCSLKFKEDQTEQKLRGGYYTPIILADFIMEWVGRARPETILEPSCGDGVFIQAVKNCKLDNCEFIAVERNSQEARKAELLSNDLGLAGRVTVNNWDYLETAVNQPDMKFDAVVGNPPFIRYQFLEEEDQEYSKTIFERNNLKFTKHTNAWVPFIIASINMLNDGGRLGMVVPAEIFHVMHAAPLRKFLLDTCHKLVIFDPKDIWFKDTLQGAVIIFAEKKDAPEEECLGLGIQETNGYEFTQEDPENLYNNARMIPVHLLQDKWTISFLSNTTITLIKQLLESPDVYNFSDLATVAVGVVTGANNFFLVSDDIVEEYELQDYCSPMFGKSNHCKGVIYDQKQHDSNAQRGLPSNFLYIEDEFESLPKRVQDYIKLGEEQDLHKRYKCRIREPWYKVPSVYSTNIGMLKRSHNIPRVIHNELEAYTTDTAYRMTITESWCSPELFSYCFVNPVTAIFAELEGRHYGGGVLELVPSEIRKLYIPVPRIDVNIQELNNRFLNNEPIEEVLFSQGRHILESLSGVTVNTEIVQSLINDWQRLRLRRQREELT